MKRKVGIKERKVYIESERRRSFWRNGRQNTFKSSSIFTWPPWFFLYSSGGFLFSWALCSSPRDHLPATSLIGGDFGKIIKFL